MLHVTRGLILTPSPNFHDFLLLSLSPQLYCHRPTFTCFSAHWPFVTMTTLPPRHRLGWPFVLTRDVRARTEALLLGVPPSFMKVLTFINSSNIYQTLRCQTLH